MLGFRCLYHHRRGGFNQRVAQVGVFLRIGLLWRFGAVQQDERVRLNGVFKAANERLLLAGG